MVSFNAARAWVKARIYEPSTWAGIGVALTPFAAFDRTILWIAAACGTVAALLRDPPKAQANG